MAKVDLKAYAKSFHSPVQKPKSKPAEEGKITWRDISARNVAINRDDYRDQPTVRPKRPVSPKDSLAVTIAAQPRKGYVYYVGDGHGRIKIGFSANPWSRIKEAKCFNPSIEILATERDEGEYLEQRRHEQFKQYHLALEWFSEGEELMKHIEQLRPKQ